LSSYKSANEKYQYCNFDAALSSIIDPLESPDFSAQEISHIEEEAKDLAHQAYGRQDAASLAHAERMLYLIHSKTAFSPPLDSLSGRIWPVLARAKLLHELTRLEPKQEVSAEFLVKEFTRAVARADEEDNSLIDEIALSGELKNIKKYVKNYLASTGGFTHQLFALTKTSMGPLKRVLVNNLADEFEDNKEHRELRYLWPRQLGIEIIPEEAVHDPDYLTESFSLQNFRTLTSLLPQPHLGLGMFFSVEAVFPGICKRLRPALIQFGVEERYLDHLVIHESVDGDHLEEGLNAIRETIKSERELALVLAGALGQIRSRHLMFSAVRKSFGDSGMNHRPR
jgi:hypothetical protein